MAPIETWAVISGFSGYHVSSRGRVRNANTKLVLAQRTCKTGDLIVNLAHGSGIAFCKVAHLVANEFVDNPCALKAIGFHDGNLMNCSASNLYFIH